MSVATAAPPLHTTDVVSTSRPWYCTRAVHGVAKSHKNVDGTTIFFVQETPCDCPPPPPLRQPHPPATRGARSAQEARSMAGVRRRYRLPAPRQLPRLAARRAPPATAATDVLTPVPPPPRTLHYAQPLTPSHVVVSAAQRRCSPLQQDPTISVVAPLVFPPADVGLSQPLSVPPMNVAGVDALAPWSARHASLPPLTVPGSSACGEDRHDHFKSFGFAFCPQCGAGLMPLGALPQYTPETCPVTHVRTGKSSETPSSGQTVGLSGAVPHTAAHQSGIQVLAVTPPEAPAADTSPMRFCLLCGAQITYVAAGGAVPAVSAPPPLNSAPSFAHDVVPLGTTPPSTVLGLSQAGAEAASAPPLSSATVTPPPPQSLPPAGPLGMRTPDPPSVPPPNPSAPTLPPPPPPQSTPPPVVPPAWHLEGMTTQEDQLTRRDMQSVDAVLASLLRHAETATAAGDSAAANRGCCGLPGCPLCLRDGADVVGRTSFQEEAARGDKPWWCGSPAVMIVHNHYYGGGRC